MRLHPFVQDDLFSRLPLNKRRTLTTKPKTAEPASPSASAAAAYVGAGSEIDMEIILRKDAEGMNPGCRRVLFALLEKGVQFQEVSTGSADEAALPELVLGDELVCGWEKCLLALENAVLQVPLLPPDAGERARALELMQDAQALLPDAGVSSMWGAKQRQETMEKLQAMETLLSTHEGVFALGNTFSLVDVALFPALEMCDAQASILVPALRPSQDPAFPALQQWFSAMDSRIASYRSRVKGDTFSAAQHLAKKDPALSAVALEGSKRILVEDSWKDAVAEPIPAAWNAFSERFPSVAKTPRQEAAAYLYDAREALWRETASSVPECVKGARRPRATQADGSRADMVDATLRLLMSAMIEAPDYASSPKFANTFISTMIQDLDVDQLTEVKEALLFLREAARAPRDMGELPARQWRSHASWLGSEVRKLIKKKTSQAAADTPKPLRSRY